MRTTAINLLALSLSDSLPRQLTTEIRGDSVLSVGHYAIVSKSSQWLGNTASESETYATFTTALNPHTDGDV